MSYCLNPSCSEPKNSTAALVCKACGSKLIVRDRYRSIATLGKGGFGATFLAIDEFLPGQPSCVIKQLRPSIEDPNVLQMAKELFQREAQTLGKIGNHPQIPRLLDYFEDNQEFYLVQEYVSGHDLYQEVKLNGPYSETKAKQFLSEILPILKYVHSQNTIHRDIKPANIIRREQDRQLVLIDFGAVKNKIAPANLNNNSEETALTAFAVGTAGFAPPEQIAMRPVYASDIYAAGATCLYLLTGKSPKEMDFNSITGEIMWRKYVEVSDSFARVLQTMLEASVAHRYKDADEVLKALDIIPYFESLSQGLIQQPNSTDRLSSNFPSPSDRNLPDSPSSNEAAVAKLATAIRSRKSRNNLEVGRSLSRSNPGDLPEASPRSDRRADRGDRSLGSAREARTGITTVTNQKIIKTSRQITDSKLNADAVIANYLRGERDFVQRDLSYLNLRKANLPCGIFHQSQLMKVDLSGANLSNTDFGRANLIQAQLRKANLSRAYLGYADLEGADLRGADLSFAHFYCANLRGANLCGANLSNAKISDKQLEQAKTNWMTIMPNGSRRIW